MRAAAPASKAEAQTHLGTVRDALTFAATLHHNGHTLVETNAHPVLRTASIGKLFVLTALAIAAYNRKKDPTTRLDHARAQLRLRL